MSSRETSVARPCDVRGYVLALVGAALLALSTWAAAASSAYVPNVDRGRALYQAQCEQCHTPNIHSRPNKLPLTRDELRGIVDQMRRVSSLGWTRDEVEDVVEYLNRTRYRFAPER
jgi:mono/diheme cytochrome c family protein